MRNEDIKDLLELHTKAIKAEVKANHDMLSLKIDGITDRQDIANHRVNEIEKKCDVYSKHVDNTNAVKKYSKWIVLATFVVIFGSSLLSHWLIENVDARKTLENNTGIELITE